MTRLADFARVAVPPQQHLCIHVENFDDFPLPSGDLCHPSSMVNSLELSLLQCTVFDLKVDHNLE